MAIEVKPNQGPPVFLPVKDYPAQEGLGGTEYVRVPGPVLGGQHYDAGKPRVDLLPIGGLFAVAEVMAYGARKYGERNWQSGIQHSKLVGSCLRHVFKRLRGEVLDDESGLPHLAHAAANLLMVLDMLTTPGADDLPVTEPVQGSLLL